MSPDILKKRITLVGSSPDSFFDQSPTYINKLNGYNAESLEE